MDEAAFRAVQARSMANEKLLLALITLLAVRDKPLLDEMNTVFALAKHVHSAVGEGSDRVWGKVEEQMRAISLLASEEGLERLDGHGG